MRHPLREKYWNKYDGEPPFQPESNPLETYIAFCEEQYLIDVAEVARKARLAEAQWFESRALANVQCDGNLDVSLGEIRRRIAALQAEGGQG